MTELKQDVIRIQETISSVFHRQAGFRLLLMLDSRTRRSFRKRRSGPWSNSAMAGCTSS